METPVAADALAGDWFIFRWEDVLCEKRFGRKHEPVPFLAARRTVVRQRFGTPALDSVSPRTANVSDARI